VRKLEEKMTMPSNAEPLALDLVTRREAIRRVSALLGGVALVGQARLLEARLPVTSEAPGDLFTATDVSLLDEIAETILPETKTPGAKAAGVGPFMALMVADTYDPDEQKIFREGLGALDRECVKTHGHAFVRATPAERRSLLERIDREQYEYMKPHEDEEDFRPVHYFRMMKELALLGYFTSEIGYKEAQRYVETPGRFDPCAPYLPGDKAWAPHA
jgi:glucoside 3-dehydrogenase (cytochrome c) hitch-hiker subunit